SPNRRRRASRRHTGSRTRGDASTYESRGAYPTRGTLRSAKRWWPRGGALDCFPITTNGQPLDESVEATNSVGASVSSHTGGLTPTSRGHHPPARPSPPSEGDGATDRCGRPTRVIDPSHRCPRPSSAHSPPSASFGTAARHGSAARQRGTTARPVSRSEPPPGNRAAGAPRAGARTTRGPPRAPSTPPPDG